MRRLRAKLIALTIAFAAAALIPGAAVFARPANHPSQRVEKCEPEAPTNVMPTRAELADFQVIVIGTVQPVETGEQGFARLSPEAFLKGPASAHEITLTRGVAGACDDVNLFPIGERVLLMLGEETGPSTWPLVGDNVGYLLQDGRAISLNAANNQTVGNAPTEAQVVDHIRGITGQYAVPAKTASEGASLGWVKVVVPVAIALLVILGIGLVLMRIWHRIDPT